MHALTLDVDSAEASPTSSAGCWPSIPAVNVLINNAGVMRIEPVDTARDLSAAEETITTNLLGPIRLIDALVDHLKAQPDAAIVNVTSGLRSCRWSMRRSIARPRRPFTATPCRSAMRSRARSS